MPRAAKVCGRPGCWANAERQGYCLEHAPAPWHRKSTARRYPPDWAARVRRTLRRDPVCQACHAAPSVTADHRVPLFEGGTHDLANLQGLCQPCHDTKTRAESARARRGRGGPPSPR